MADGTGRENVSDGVEGGDGWGEGSRGFFAALRMALVGGGRLVVCLFSIFVAEAAVAVGVVEFAGGVAEGFGAVLAGAQGAVGEGFAGRADLAGRGDLVLVRSEDDAVDGVVELCGDERAGLEVDGGGAVGVDDGVGVVGLEPAFGDGEGGEVEVGLDGGAVLGELEGDADGAVSFGARGEAALAGVVVAEVSVFDGGALAVRSGRHDVAT